MSANMQGMDEIQVDVKNLYREEGYTDLKVATLRKMIPIQMDGSDDDTRKAFFMGTTHVMLPIGPQPVQCRIDAESLEEAIKAFPEEIKKAIDKLIEDVREMQRQEANRIVVPEAGAGGGKIELA